MDLIPNLEKFSGNFMPRLDFGKCHKFSLCLMYLHLMVKTAYVSRWGEGGREGGGVCVGGDENLWV